MTERITATLKLKSRTSRSVSSENRDWFFGRQGGFSTLSEADKSEGSLDDSSGQYVICNFKNQEVKINKIQKKKIIDKFITYTILIGACTKLTGRFR